MSTRVTSAIASRKARENLVRLLFPAADRPANPASSATSSMPLPDDTKGMRYTDRHSHGYRRRHRPSKDDAARAGRGNQTQSRHSYSQLRAAYLERVHDMHPDKIAHRERQQPSTEDGFDDNKNNATKEAHFQFIELKHAWEEYHASMRLVRDTVSINNNKNSAQDDDCYWEEDEETFTMFGVGCSFADSPEERALRDEITDQACRGWFSSGSLTHEEKQQSLSGAEEDDAEATKKLRMGMVTPLTKLSDDDMFVHDNQSDKEEPSPRKFLVQGLDTRSRRKR